MRMKASHILFWQATGKEPASGYQQCVLCGGQAYPLVGPITKWVSGNFTAWSSLHDGEGICEACAYALKEPQLRRHSYMATPDKLLILNHENTVPTLLSLPTDVPYIFVITTSHKKHLWPLAVVNHGNAVACLQFDESHILWEPEVGKELLDKVETLRQAGLTREEIFTLTIGGARHKKMTPELWGLIHDLYDIKKTPLLQFLAYIARKERTDETASS